MIFQILVVDWCSFGFEKAPFWLAKDALLDAN